MSFCRNYQIEHIVAPKAVKSRSSVPRPPRPVSASSSVSSRSAASYSPSVSPGRMDRESSSQAMTADEAAAHVSRVLSSVYSSVESLPAGHSVEGHQYSGKDRQNYRLVGSLLLFYFCTLRIQSYCLRFVFSLSSIFPCYFVVKYDFVRRKCEMDAC